MNKTTSSRVGRVTAIVVGAILPFALLLTLLCPAANAASANPVLRGHVPSLVAQATPLGRLPASAKLSLAISLPLKNVEALDALLKDVYNPASPNFRQYLTPAQFAARFGPTEQEYQAVVGFMTDAGLAVTYRHPNRLVVDVSGSVADIEKTFHISMRVYQHPTEPRTFYAPDSDPTVDLPIPLLEISGLDNAFLRYPKLKERPVALADATSNAGSGPGGGYRGNDFRAAYIPGTTLTGAGQSVGLLQFDSYYPNDIATYASLAGLSVPKLVNVPVDGGVSTPGSGNGEVSLDIEMVLSMAPEVSTIYVYMAPNPSPWVDLLSRMANDNLAKQLSCSWGGGAPNASAEQIFKQMAAQGQSFYNASGDSDAFTGSIPFPADSTNITQVGATTLSTTGPGGAYVSETVWNWGQVNGSYVGSGGGISTYYGLPAYQQGIDMSANQGSTTFRNVPDVALVGDNIYVVYNNGSSGAFGGTSCAAPLWAGFTALINQQAAAKGIAPVGFVNPAVYLVGKSARFGSDFHDITTGNNFSSSSPSKFAAVAGYDLCTGWGSPNGTNLINALTSAMLESSQYSLLAGSYLPANGAIEPGETVTVALGLLNRSAVSSSNVVATLLPIGGVTFPGPAQSYGSVPGGGGTATQSFVFTAAGACGGIITPTLQLQDGALGLGTVSYTIQLGKLTIPQPFTENFDAVTAPALPPGWTTATTGAQPLWISSSAASDTAPNAAFTSGAATAGVNELVSPSFAVATSTAQVTFRQNYNLQSQSSFGRDGGVLEISIGNGVFQDMLTAGGSFASGGYVKTLSSSRGNPLGGRQAWTGNSSGFITTVVNLPASAAGQAVRLKWRCGTDSSTASTGWYIDSVTVADGGVYVCLSPTTDVAVSQTASADTITVGSTLVFSLNVTNLGPVPASNVVITDALPPGFSFLSGSPGCLADSGLVSCFAGQLDIGASTNFILTVSPVAPGICTNFVTATTSILDTNQANNYSSLTTTVLSLPNLEAVPTTWSFGYVAVGQVVTQSFAIINAGETTLIGTASVAAPFAVADGSPFSINGGQTGYLAVAFSPTAAGLFRADLLLTSNGGNSTNSVTGVGAYPPVAGFSLAPSAGAAPLTVAFSDLSLGTVTNRFWDFGDGTTTKSLATSVTHVYGAGTNTVTLIASGPLGVSTNIQPAAVIATNQVAAADLAIAITASPEPVFNSPFLSYSISLSNAGPQNATGVLITNLLPPEAVFLSAAASQGVCSNLGQTVVCDLGALSNSALATVFIAVSISATNPVTLLTNVAAVTAAQNDPFPGNNTAQVVSTVWLDSVGDGIPDWWRAQYFGADNSTNATSCAVCDPDGDGAPNLAEFIADTDPTNSTSVLAITTLSLVPGGVRIEWQGGTHARQFLQTESGPLSGNEVWTDLFTNEPPTPTVNSLTNTFTTNRAQFFRVRAARP